MAQKNSIGIPLEKVNALTEDAVSDYFKSWKNYFGNNVAMFGNPSMAVSDFFKFISQEDYVLLRDALSDVNSLHSIKGIEGVLGLDYEGVQDRKRSKLLKVVDKFMSFELLSQIARSHSEAYTPKQAPLQVPYFFASMEERIKRLVNPPIGIYRSDDGL